MYITADECAGVAFSLALCAISVAGYELFEHASMQENSRGWYHGNGESSTTCNSVNSDSCCSNASTDDIDSESENAAVGIEPYNVVYVLELLLAFHAWYHKGHPFLMQNLAEKELIQNAIKEMLEEVKTKAPHHEKCGWKLQKFHDHLHVVDDMEKFGSPLNTVNGPTSYFWSYL